MRTFLRFLVLLLFLPANLPAQASPPFSFSLTPGAQLPLGPDIAAGVPYYSLGWGADLDGEIALSGVAFLAGRASLGFASIPIATTTKQVTILSLGVGPSLNLSLLPRLGAKLAVVGGYAVLFGPARIVPNPFAAASLKASFVFSSLFTLGVAASYRAHFSSTGLDYHGLELMLDASFGIGQGTQKSMLQVLDVGFDPVFPVFFKYYDTNAAGALRVKNGETGTIRKVRVSFLVPQYMAGPKDCAVFESLNAGEEREVPIYALFTDSIIGITEDTKVNAKVRVEYTYMGAELKGETDLSLRIYNRNAMTWEDDRRAAAFVSAKDPSVLSFAKTAAGIAREQGAAVNAKFRQAMGIFQALGVYGLRYVPDPTSPFSNTAKSRQAIDYLQFPAQTLAYKAGDCDDLSICYAAMLEATGTEAAFLTVPGHILVAFKLDMDTGEARSAFSRPDDLIYQEGQAWIPVEVTMLREGFCAAWKTGAKEWREADAKGAGGFHTIREAWNLYEAAPYPGGDPAAPFPSAEAESAAFGAESARFVDEEVKVREAPIRREIAGSANDPKPVNKLGVLYARYGLYDRAAAEFEKAAAFDYVPALMNLGNIALLKPDPQKARTLFERAYRTDATSVAVIVGLAKANYAVEDWDAVKVLYRKLKTLDPRTADRFAYLVAGSGGGERAAEAGRDVILWSESD